MKQALVLLLLLVLCYLHSCLAAFANITQAEVFLGTSRAVAVTGSDSISGGL